MIEPQILNKYIGWPFKEGGRDEQGIDCLGLVLRYLQDRGYNVKAGDSEGYLENFDKTLELVEKLRLKEKNPIMQENDVIYFSRKREAHCGVYLGYDKYLHISDGLTSRVSHINSFARNRILGIIRPSETEENILPVAGRRAVVPILAVVGAVVVAYFAGPGLAAHFFAAVYGATLGASIGYAITAREPGDLEGGLGAGSPKYKFGALHNTRSNEIPVPLIYGECRVAGNIIYSSPLTGGTTVYQFIALSEGPVNAIGTVRFNDQTWSDFPGCSYTAYLGTSSQNVDSRGSADVNGLRRTAYLAITFEASEKLPNLPTVTSVVEGLKVETWAASAWSGSTYSQNPAACIRDYLLRSKEIGGAGLASGDIDDTSFGSVYDTCAASVSDGAGSTEARYELNYVIDTRRSVLDNLQDMLASFGGYLVYKAGKLHLGVKKSASVDHTFTMSNIKAGSFSYGYIPKENQINKVGVQYLDIDQGDVKPIAWVDDYEDQATRGIVEKVFPMLGIGRFSQAARMAWQILYDLKVNPIFCNFETGINALDVEPGDIAQVSHDIPSWTNKQFLIVAIQETVEDEVALDCIAFNTSIYNDGYGSGIETIDYGSPPSAYDSPPDVSDFSVEISKRTDLYMRWAKPSLALEATIRNYEIREGATWTVGWIVATLAANQFSYRMPILASGTRTFLIKAISQMGKYSTNSAQDSVAISAIPMSNVIASSYLWKSPGVYGGHPSLVPD